jgi:2',3'-cyclic-nucleotide 2'-phosphodiesterase (5'-nucleotidase family)
MNAGGFRVSIETGTITMGDLVDSYIFDNYIMTSQVTGAMLNDFCIYVKTYNRDVVFDDSVTCTKTGGFTVNGQSLINSQLYTIAAVDYVFEKTDYVFLKGINITNTGLLIRDLLAMDLRATIGFFNPANGTSYQAVTPQKMTPSFFPSVQSKFIDDIRRALA